MMSRLILEPSKAAKLQRNFRTGRRLNMRKIIPYIANQFKNDKTWLRRVKPNKRELKVTEPGTCGAWGCWWHTPGSSRSLCC